MSYNQMVAFGDNLSDNGNGSCAHGVAGDPETVYGFATWTDGPVAVSYLSDMLGGAIPPEMLAALRKGSFESLVSHQGDDEDLMKDPSVQIDMRVSPFIEV